MIAAVQETIYNAIELARKAGKKSATAAFIEDIKDDEAEEVLKQLEINGFHASYSRYYDSSYSPILISTLFEVKW
jgi:hypothetical protein